MLTTKQAAERLQVKPITVQRWLQAGTLKGTKLPGRAGWRIPESEIDRLLGGESTAGKAEAA
jgi:excisionase family DNA binding protein